MCILLSVGGKATVVPIPDESLPGRERASGGTTARSAAEGDYNFAFGSQDEGVVRYAIGPRSAHYTHGGMQDPVTLVEP